MNGLVDLAGRRVSRRGFLGGVAGAVAMPSSFLFAAGSDDAPVKRKVSPFRLSVITDEMTQDF